jgi:hypothetical protein
MRTGGANRKQAADLDLQRGQRGDEGAHAGARQHQRAAPFGSGGAAALDEPAQTVGTRATSRVASRSR